MTLRGESTSRRWHRRPGAPLVLWLALASTLAAAKAFGVSLFGRPSWYQVDGPAVRVVAAEIDRENGLDLVTGNDAGAAGPSLSLLLNRGGGSFFPQVRTSLNPAQYILHTIAARDFDGDGAADVAVAVDDLRVFPIRTEVLVYRNTGSGQLLTPDEYPLGGLFPQCLRAGDVSGDGILDLIVCHSTVDTGAGLVSVLTGQGVAGVPDGTFDAGTDLRVGTSPVTVAIADVDADGHEDLVVGDSAQRTVSVLYGGGSAALFEPPVLLGSVKAVSAILVSDSPGEGLPTILVASLSEGNVLIFRQRSPRAFDPPASIAVRQPPADMGMADFDGDGIPDLVLLSFGNGQVDLWRGDTSGTFTFDDTASVEEGGSSLTVADLNRDAKPDVATSSFLSDRVSVVLNGTNAPLTPTPTGRPTNPTTPAPPTGTTVPTAATSPGTTATRTSTATPPPATPTVTPTAAGPGDANCDGRLDSSDISGVVTRLFTSGCGAADANGDGRVTAADLTLIIQIVTGAR